jgi:hypothetical protein
MTEKKRYVVRGIPVTSEILSDRILEQLVDGHQWRTLTIRSSCESPRWGVRILEHSLSGRADSDLLAVLERVRLEQASILVRQELGETKEVPNGAVAIAVAAPGEPPSGSALVAQIDIGDRTRLHPEVIEFKKLPPAGTESGGRAVFQADVFFEQATPVRLRIGSLMPDPNGFTPAAKLGGDFFEAYLKDRRHLFFELLDTEPVRTLRNASRCKKNCVLILGHYGEDRPRLETIRGILSGFNLRGMLAEDFDDIEEQDMPQKVITLMSLARFVICDDIIPAGQNSELEITKWLQPVVAILRKDGRPTTMMQASIDSGVTTRKVFGYMSEDEWPNLIGRVVNWANGEVEKQTAELNRVLYWRRGQNVLR